MDFIQIPEDRNYHNRMAERTIGGMFWMFSGTGFQVLLQISVLTVLARILTPKDYGVVGAASIVLGFSGVFSQLGVGPAIVQLPNLKDIHLRTSFTLSILFALLIVTALWLFAPTLSSFFRIAELTGVLHVLSLCFVFQGASVTSLSLLERQLRFRTIACIEAFSYAIGYGFVGITLSLLNFGVWALVFAQLSHSGVLCLSLLVLQPHSRRPILELAAVKELLGFGSAITIGKTFNYLARNGDNLIVGRWLGAESLGLYGRAYKLMTLPSTLFGTVFDRVLFPSIAKVQGEPDRVARAYKQAVSATAVLTLPLTVIITLLAPEIVCLLLGTKWIAVVGPLRILAVAAFFRTAYKIGECTARALGGVRSIAFLQTLYALLVFAAAWTGQHWGISGVAAGVGIALCLTFLLLSHLALCLTHVSITDFFQCHFKGILLSTILFVQLFLLAKVMRHFQFPPLLTILCAGFLVSSTILIILRIRPSFLFASGIVESFCKVKPHIYHIIQTLSQSKTV